MTRLAVGDQAPDFTLTDQAGAEVRLVDLRGRALVVFCYPAAMTPGCTTEACDFRDRLDTMHENGFEVIGISPDSPATPRRVRCAGVAHLPAAERPRPVGADRVGCVR